MVSKHVFHLGAMTPQNQYAEGSRAKATKSNFPTLQKMSLYKLILKPQGIREPHWHANADELGYCLSGKVLVTMYATKNVRQAFVVNEGDAFYIPSGTLHGLENIGDETSELVLQFSDDEPEDFALSSTVGMFSDSVLGNTWGVQANVFAPLKRSTEDREFICKREHPFEMPQEAQYSSPYHYNLQGSAKLITNEAGTVKVARQDVWPVLQRQALYSLQLTGVGMREPHWHPETAELGYVETGRGRMSILSPDGTVDTYEINSGDIYFIPAAYPHHIENLSSQEDLRIKIFFDKAIPEDIGFTASIKAFSNEVLSASLDDQSNIIANLPKFYADKFIVKKINPVD